MFVSGGTTSEPMTLRTFLIPAISLLMAVSALANEPATPQAPTELSDPALAAAVDELASGKRSADQSRAFVRWSELVTPSGQVYVPVVLYLPQSSGIEAGRELTFFGVIRDAEGRTVRAFEKPVTLAASKYDAYAETSLALGEGKHRGFFGLAAEDGKPLVLVASEIELAGSLDRDAAAVSPLILSNNLYPLEQAHEPDAPFAFGGVKVVPKGDRTFRQSDELWYFVELRNPGVADDAPSADGTVVPILDGMPPRPRIQVKIDVTGVDATGKSVKLADPPLEIEAFPLKGVSGRYGIGRAFPLDTFLPGEYTFTIKLMDTVKKTSYTLSDTFRIVE